MKDYQIRVVEEKKSLDEKLEKLTAFLKSKTVDVNGEELRRLQRQEKYMQLYSQVLAERIENFI